MFAIRASKFLNLENEGNLPKQGHQEATGSRLYKLENHKTNITTLHKTTTHY